MIPPALALWRVTAACIHGLVLGAVYSFLRPLRPRALADMLFVAALLYVSLIISFAICKGDPRFADHLGMYAGLTGWLLTFGKWLRPVFSGFWKGMGRFARGILYPGKKIFEKMRQIIKNIFASLEKWVTIKWNNRRHARRKTGGPNGKAQKIFGIHQTGIQKDAGTDEDRSGGDHRIVYGSPSGAARRH